MQPKISLNPIKRSDTRHSSQMEITQRRGFSLGQGFLELPLAIQVVTDVYGVFVPGVVEPGGVVLGGVRL